MARRLLLDESPLFLLPSLAVALGTNEALILQQFNYWLQASKNEWDGYLWTYNSYRAWQKQFPFMSKETIGRAIRSLEKKGLLISTVGPNRKTFDRTKWYRIDFDKFEELFPERSYLNKDDSELNQGNAEMNQEDVKLTRSQNRPMYQNEPTIPDKITTKNTTKSNNKGTTSSSKKPRQKPEITRTFDFIYQYFGYPDRTNKDPIPNHGKEAKAIARMLQRGYSEDDICYAWKQKVLLRGEYVSMVYVNEDIGKPNRPRQSSFLPREEELVAQAKQRGLN